MARIGLFVRVVAVALLTLGFLGLPNTMAANASSDAISLYASPTGSGGECVATQPCALSEVQALVSSAISGGKDVVVQLAGGTYTLSAPLAPASGSAGLFSQHRVIYRAAPGQQSVLSGGRRVTGWRLYSRSRNIWVAHVPGLHPTRQLYVNGRRAVVASAPASAVLGNLQLTNSGYLASRANLA
ncbi:MAG TPA: hypothetical protein VN108_05980, partial [Marmoricola sp.]|nr:hypothetical protein [Marmoricola sp.]